MDINSTLAQEFKIRKEQVDNTVKLIDEGNTIPFIARYRKEVTGGLDDQLLRELSERLSYLRNLEQRKAEVSESISAGGNMTGEIAESLEKALTLAEVEDIYRPFKPKRKTRASVAKEKGLEPLAEFIMAQTHASPYSEADKFINTEKGVEARDDAIAGALDIIAENVSDNPEIRKRLAVFYNENAVISSKAVNPDEDTVYSNYYDYSEAVKKIPTHRILAIDRGEREEKLKVVVEVEEKGALAIIEREYVRAKNENGKLVAAACEDSFSRLIHPSMERRVRNELTEKACTSAIHVFSDNLRQLLMQPPVKNSVTLGLDPAYRTGCKIAVVDGTGKAETAYKKVRS